MQARVGGFHKTTEPQDDTALLGIDAVETGQGDPRSDNGAGDPHPVAIAQRIEAAATAIAAAGQGPAQLFLAAPDDVVEIVAAIARAGAIWSARRAIAPGVARRLPVAATRAATFTTAATARAPGAFAPGSAIIVVLPGHPVSRSRLRLLQGYIRPPFWDCEGVTVSLLPPGIRK